jgi:predicted transcriptional regulator
MEIMNTAEIKLELFRRIDSLKGKALEDAYQHMLSFLNKSDVNPELQSGIERALKDVEEGRVSSHEDVTKRMKKKYPNLVK